MEFSLVVSRFLIPLGIQMVISLLLVWAVFAGSKRLNPDFKGSLAWSWVGAMLGGILFWITTAFLGDFFEPVQEILRIKGMRIAWELIGCCMGAVMGFVYKSQMITSKIHVD
ncbi:MAG: hypothetical protein H6581_17575 [Bacteroidia bacterium]|nr:hypothetical protein [Bacteroidia bacterium]